MRSFFNMHSEACTPAKNNPKLEGCAQTCRDGDCKGRRVFGPVSGEQKTRKCGARRRKDARARDEGCLGVG